MTNDRVRAPAGAVYGGPQCLLREALTLKPQKYMENEPLGIIEFVSKNDVFIDTIPIFPL